MRQATKISEARSRVVNAVFFDGVFTAMVESFSERGKYYGVVIDLNEEKAACSCPGFLAHSRCKHIAAALTFLRENYGDFFLSSHEESYRKILIKHARR